MYDAGLGVRSPVDTFKIRTFLVSNGRSAVVHRVSSSLSGPVEPSFRALSGRPKLTVRRHKLNKDSFSRQQCGGRGGLGYDAGLDVRTVSGRAHQGRKQKSFM